MADNVETVPAVDKPAEKVAEGVQTAPVIDVQAEIKKALEESDKKWQSRFDKVLAEKKTVETVKMTTEERLAKIEQESKLKELNWARKEARAKASIGDALDAAIAVYQSDDPEGISRGASEIRRLIDAETGPLKAKIEDLEKKLKYGSNPPAAGSGGGNVITEADFNKMSPVQRSEFMAIGGRLE